MLRAAIALLLPAFLAAAAPATAAPGVSGVTVEQTSFRIALTDGRVLTQEQLPGVILALGDGSGQQRHIRIDTVEHGDNGIVLYALSERDSATGAWTNICEPAADGRRLGFPIAGRFTADARHIANPDQLLIACTAGAEAKCIHLGYTPWHTGAQAHYQACIRMIRADYCGDGISRTRNGTMIGITDRIGIRNEPPPPGMSFEAAWGPNGAVCVRRTRIPELFSMDDLRRTCPDHAPAECGGSTPALLYVSSFPQ